MSQGVAIATQGHIQIVHHQKEQIRSALLLSRFSISLPRDSAVESQQN